MSDHQISAAATRGEPLAQSRDVQIRKADGGPYNCMRIHGARLNQRRVSLHRSGS